MTTKQTLAKLVDKLDARGIAVQFLDSGAEDLEIGQLRDGVITLNRQSRDDRGMVFTIAHLFWHYCQFMNYDKYRHLVDAVAAPVPISLSPAFRLEFLEYEREAFGIGKSLIQEVRRFDEQWDRHYRSFMVADFEHFWTYITTGCKQDAGSFNKQLSRLYQQRDSNRDPIEAVPIPVKISTSALHPSVTIF